jgi:tetratricopeptide (TPR) repeat protein
MKLHKKITAYCLQPPAYCLLSIVYCLLLTACCLLFAGPISAQETEPSADSESLQLPEVVITGIDRSKIQRMIPKETVSLSSLPAITQSSRDLSEALTQEGDGLFINRTRQAEERYAKAIELDPTNSTAYLRLGDVYGSLNRYVDAAEVYRKALDISADNLEAHYKLGMLYEDQLQNLQQAIEHYRSYLQLGGSDRRVKVWLRNAERQMGEK